MTLTGTIQSIQPLGGYDSQGGYINTFSMTIQCQDGQHTGEIGSKSNPYPMNIGEQIVVMESNTQHGIKFKKVNTQYAGNQQGGNQGEQQPPQQNQQPQRQAPQQDNVQDRIAFAQAYNRACDEYNADKISEEQIQERTRMHYKVLTTRQFPLSMSLSGPQQDEQPQFQQPADQKAGYNPPVDDIPF